MVPTHFLPIQTDPGTQGPGLTQNGLSDVAELHVNQIRRYEAGTAQPTLDALIRLAKVLHVRLDDLVFGEQERGPSDDLALQFEAVSQFSEAEKQTVRELLEGMILKHEARRWDSARAGAAAKKPAAGTKRG